jgi:xylan 1,4-beta-xylosidase
VVLANSIKLADRYKVNLEGLLTWAFEFEGQPYFDGLRSLATNGIDKPVLNFFRMAGLMRGNRIRVTSDGALGLDEILKNGVREKPDIDGMATAGDHEISIMIWNYHDDSLPAPAASVRVALEGIPPAVARVLLKHYRIDDTHSNSNTVWKEMGSPQQPTADQYARMEAAGQLQLLESPRWVAAGKGAVRLDFSLPRHGISLLQLSW